MKEDNESSVETRGRPRIYNISLNPKQLKAIHYFMLGYTIPNAAKAAGFSRHYGKELFENPLVREEIKRRKKHMSQKHRVDENWVIKRLVDIAGADLGDMLEVDEKGDARLDFSKITPELRVAITKFSADKVKVGRGSQKDSVSRVRVESADKLRALEMLARILGMYEDKIVIQREEDLVARLHAGRKRAGEENAGDEDGAHPEAE